MNKEEIREYIVAKRTPISHCVDLTKCFIGRHKTLPIFLTPAFEMEFNRSMQELEILREQEKKQKEVIDKLKNKTKENIENAKCEITTLTIGDKAYYQYIEKILDNYVDILKEVE